MSLILQALQEERIQFTDPLNPTHIRTLYADVLLPPTARGKLQLPPTSPATSTTVNLNGLLGPVTIAVNGGSPIAELEYNQLGANAMMLPDLTAPAGLVTTTVPPLAGNLITFTDVSSANTFDTTGDGLVPVVNIPVQGVPSTSVTITSLNAGVYPLSITPSSTGVPVVIPANGTYTLIDDTYTIIPTAPLAKVVFAPAANPTWKLSIFGPGGLVLPPTGVSSQVQVTVIPGVTSGQMALSTTFAMANIFAIYAMNQVLLDSADLPVGTLYPGSPVITDTVDVENLLARLTPLLCFVMGQPLSLYLYLNRLLKWEVIEMEIIRWVKGVLRLRSIKPSALWI